ncbi:MAG: DUF1330 domain-containing protein [Pseudomonadota bacterium]
MTTPDAWATLRNDPRPGPVQMLNLLRFRRDESGNTSGQVTYAAYGKATAPIFARVGGRIVWMGQPEQMLIAPPDEAWDLAFLAEYPSIAAFLEMLDDPDYRAAMSLREAALADSRLIRLAPLPVG